MTTLRIDERLLFAAIGTEERDPEKVDRIAEAIKSFATQVEVPESCTRHHCPVTKECLKQHGHDLIRGSRQCRDLLKRTS